MAIGVFDPDVVPARLDGELGMKVFARTVIFAFLVLMPNTAFAEGFLDWWLTPDQQGRLYFQREDFQKSARAFEHTQWKAIAFYKAGDFSNAEVLFEKNQTAQGYFLLGNALAKQEKLAPAVEAYRQALKLQPDFAEAVFNLEWVDGLLKLSQKEYEETEGTGGKLGADRMVVDERGAKAKGEVSMAELQAERGLSDAEIRELWMRRVQTTPGDFLAYKFAYQLQASESVQADKEEKLGGSKP